MRITPRAPWEHSHRFSGEHDVMAERRTKIVMALTLVTMAVEIIAGMIFNSMALLADGWHMATHAGAFGIAVFAYSFARRHMDNPRFAFGTGKVGSLAGFASAIMLGIVAALMVWESIARLRSAQEIAFDEALLVAILGLAVNLASAVLLRERDHHAQHDHGGRHDHNLRAAYAHVLADALTSILAIAALLFGKYLGWWWMDSVMGCVGAAVILRWSWVLLQQTGAVLLDHDGNENIRSAVVAALESDVGNQVADLHVWRVGPGHWAAALSIVAPHPRELEHYKRLLSAIEGLSHVTVEVYGQETNRR